MCDLLALGQYLPKLDVCVRSAFHLIATKSRTSHYVGDVPYDKLFDHLVGAEQG